MPAPKPAPKITKPNVLSRAPRSQQQDAPEGEPGGKAADFPLVSTFNRADMARAITLMQQEIDYASTIADLEAERKKVREELTEIAERYDLSGSGFRWGTFATYYTMQPGRRTIDKTLLARYLSAEEIDSCHKQGEPYVYLKVVDSSQG